MSQQPTIGRIVLYTLNEGDVALIDEQCPMREHLPHGDRQIRNSVSPGDVYPAQVVRVFDPSVSTVNLIVQLDGKGEYWATSRTEGDGAGHWAWPPRV